MAKKTLEGVTMCHPWALRDLVPDLVHGVSTLQIWLKANKNGPLSAHLLIRFLDHGDPEHQRW